MKSHPHINNLPIYEAGKPIELVVRDYGIEPKCVIKLASNENPLGPSPKAIKAIKEAAKNANLYPDDSFYQLKEGLAAHHKVEEKNIIIGSGSDQIIEFIMHAVAGPNRAVLTAGVTFAMYGIYAQQVSARHYKTASHGHDLNELYDLYSAHKEEIAAIFLCLPNNPLGECIDASAVMDFISRVGNETLIVIDGAYMEFAAYKDPKKAISPADILKYDNVIYLGTFSKIYGLGGMRVGYGIANEDIISTLHKLRAPFNITTPSLAAAIAALTDQKHLQKTLKNNADGMKMYEKFAQKEGIEYIPSYTNFITFFPSSDSTKICDALLKQGLIIRNLKGYGLNAIRITIGTKEQNKTLLKALKKEI